MKYEDPYKYSKYYAEQEMRHYEFADELNKALVNVTLKYKDAKFTEGLFEEIKNDLVRVVRSFYKSPVPDDLVFEVKVAFDNNNKPGIVAYPANMYSYLLTEGVYLNDLNLNPDYINKHWHIAANGNLYSYFHSEGKTVPHMSLEEFSDKMELKFDVPPTENNKYKELIDKWKGVFGDPKSPSVKKEIDETAQKMLDSFKFGDQEMSVKKDTDHLERHKARFNILVNEVYGQGWEDGAAARDETIKNLERVIQSDNEELRMSQQNYDSVANELASKIKENKELKKKYEDSSNDTKYHYKEESTVAEDVTAFVVGVLLATALFCLVNKVL